MDSHPSTIAARERERAFRGYVACIAARGIRLAELVALDGGTGSQTRDIAHTAESLLKLAAIDSRKGGRQGIPRVERIDEIWRESGAAGFIEELDSLPDIPEPYPEEDMERGG